VRPTSDRVKEALFSILGSDLEGLAVLDAFAGTGALGIEALSRRAGRVVFVEEDARSLAILRRNLARLPDEGEVRVLARDANRPRTWGAGTLPVDIILADPPYGEGLVERFLEAMSEVEALGPGGLLVAEHESESDPRHPAWRGIKRRRYGDSTLSVFCRGAEEKGEPHADRDLSGDV
jgi:16S rRNA (guanine966-N2)-methyltransferase